MTRAKLFFPVIAVLLSAMLFSACGNSGASAGAAKSNLSELRFVIVPKVVHPWFDEVNKGAQKEAVILSEQLGRKVTIDYRAPTTASVEEQNTILSQAAATKPAGIAVDPLDYAGNKAVFDEIKAQGIPLILFDAPAPEGSGLTSVGNDFKEQARLAAEYLVNLIGKKGKVAIMQGVPTAPNHRERYEAHKAVFAKYPGITVVEGIDNDDIQTAQSQAAAIIAANPDLAGFTACDAAGPIGIANAIKEAGKVGKIKAVGMDSLIEILQAVKDGALQASSATIPQMQGSMAVLMMWQASLGVNIPKIVDTGIDFITPDNVDAMIKQVGGQ